MALGFWILTRCWDYFGSGFSSAAGTVQSLCWAGKFPETQQHRGSGCSWQQGSGLQLHVSICRQEVALSVRHGVGGQHWQQASMAGHTLEVLGLLHFRGLHVGLLGQHPIIIKYKPCPH